MLLDDSKKSLNIFGWAPSEYLAETPMSIRKQEFNPLKEIRPVKIVPNNIDKGGVTLNSKWG